MPDKTTLNRFPLFGLFAYRAALRMKYPEETARLLGYSTAVLYAIFKAKAQKKTESTDKEAKKMPEGGGDGQDRHHRVRRPAVHRDLRERQALKQDGRRP